MWIPSDKGIQGNELADKLAKLAATNGNKIYLLIPSNDLYEEIKSNMFKAHFSFLSRQSQIKGTQYFERYFNENKKPWFYNSNTTRFHITTINRIRSNHYNLDESIFRKFMITSSECECGDPIQDIDHILWECPKYNEERNTLIKKLNRNKHHAPYNTLEILKDPNGKNAKFITEFIKSKPS